MSTDVSLPDEDSFRSAIADLRSDASPTNWALFGHWDDNPNEIYFITSGTAGPEEMMGRMDDARVLYALVRMEETFDMSTTVKFVYVHWVGKDIPYVRKGKYGVVHGSIEEYFNPYHISIDTDNTDELTTEYIMSKIQENTGTKSKVLEAGESRNRPERGFTSGTTTKADKTGATPTKSANLGSLGRQGSSFGGVGGQAKGGAIVNIEEEVTAAIRDVRDDSHKSIWCAIGYRDNNVKNPLIVLGTGEDVEEFKPLCEDDVIVYVLIRVTDIVDDIPTVKFAYVQWVGENVKPMSRAKISTHKGTIEQAFYPFHVNIYATVSSEINTRVIMDKVQSASGSKSHVR